jgi:hypothetical protein
MNIAQHNEIDAKITKTIKPFEEILANNQHKTTINYGTIIRDALILWTLTFIGGFAMGLTFILFGDINNKQDIAAFTIAVSLENVLFLILGFTISGFLSEGNRWNHLIIVAFLLWFTSFVNIAFGFSVIEVIQALPIIWVTAGLGGTISYLFRK